MSTREPTLTEPGGCVLWTRAEFMRVRMVALAGAVAIAAAACSSTVGGQPTATPSTNTEETRTPDRTGSPTSRPSEDGTYGAPRVSRPLDASRFLARQCDVLTQAQLQTFGISNAGKPDTDSEIAKRVGPGCAWTADPAVNSTISVGFTTANKNGLSDTYRGRSRFDYFEETTVDGYPAVFNGTPDGRRQGICGITVGISDQLTFFTSEQGGRKGQASCDRAKNVATSVIATLKGGA